MDLQLPARDGAGAGGGVGGGAGAVAGGAAGAGEKLGAGGNCRELLSSGCLMWPKDGS